MKTFGDFFMLTNLSKPVFINETKNHFFDPQPLHYVKNDVTLNDTNQIRCRIIPNFEALIIPFERKK